ncbi:hypothetical protein B0H10DRAFT_1943628 [Mycena sp. CBHHK59/15]|nr:hypothetical protein B0H10DRAFT_1943628 [Mycena sp. CBHHK59/15]
MSAPIESISTHFRTIRSTYIHTVMDDTITSTSPDVQAEDIEQEALDCFDLGHDLLTQCKVASNVSDLNTAIYLFCHAAHSWLPAHPELPGCLTRLAAALGTRFSYAGELQDVQLAVAFHGGTLDLDVQALVSTMQLDLSAVEDDPGI